VKKGIPAIFCGCLGMALGLAMAFSLLTRHAEPAAYLVGEYGGCLAVFDAAAGETPREVTDVRVEHLPSADRLQLREGISVRDEKELAMLLEDLGS